MKGLYFDGKALHYRTDLAKPLATAGQSVVKVTHAAICNTDKEILKGYKPDFKGVLGHEFVGIVSDSLRPELIGKTVVGELNEGCGDCIYCNSGREKHCAARKVIGIHQKWGCFAEYMQIADHLLHEVPSGLAPEVAVYTEPLAAALEIPNSIHLPLDQPVALLGDGKLAYMIAQVLAAMGISVTVFGKTEKKLAAFESFAKTTTEKTGQFETVIDATGSPSGIALAQALVRKRGNIIVKSTYAEKVNLDLSYFVVNEIRLFGTRCGPFEPALNMLARNLIDLQPIDYYDLADFEKAFASRQFKAGFKL
ncbi:MAG: alcohol dehydrogenase [Clostridiales bacterium]|nr:MAG: alcohol dehydrogenase [Clostridiales bacterium]